MRSHSIDWFFKFRDAPCFVPSNGFELPDAITIQTNRIIQEKVYNDILGFLNAPSSLESPSKVSSLVEWNAFTGNSTQSLSHHQQNDFPSTKDIVYLSARNYCFFADSVDFVLMNEYRINQPTKEQRRSFIRQFIPMARRGFICFYPFENPDLHFDFTYILIGGPYGLTDKEITFAQLLLDILPDYLLPSYSYRFRPNLNSLEYKESPSSLDSSIFKQNGFSELFK